MTDLPMQTTQLGRSGLKISKVVLGTMSYGTSDWQKWVLNEDESLPLLKHAYDVGLRTWDTADTYSNGASEQIIGKALKQYDIPRHKVVILSKCYFGVDDDGKGGGAPIWGITNDGEWANRMGLSRKHILDAVDKSIERLGTYIDVLQIHRLDRDTPREEIMRALNDVVESGKVRYIGASSVSASPITSPCIPPNTVPRWQPGNSRPSKTSPTSTTGTSSSPCKTTTTCSTARKSAR
jgi:aryl-alcohol dehydrogenase-like predicted oxidoreductase